MAISLDDVRHVAALARLGLGDDQARTIAKELSTILEHMAVLANVDTEGLDEVVGVGAPNLPLRPDEGPPIPLQQGPEAFAPRMQDGFFLVPRLTTHEDVEGGA